MKQPDSKFAIVFETFHPLTWKQRFKILLGYNVKSVVTVVLDRSKLTEAKAKTELHLTEFIKAEDTLKETEAANV